jgi:hypothetical protein
MLLHEEFGLSVAVEYGREAATDRQGYRAHDTANPRRVFISGQKRGVFGIIKRELRRRSAIEAVIGHLPLTWNGRRFFLLARGVYSTPPTMLSLCQ